MPNPRYKQAMKEALAQARSDLVQLDTIEITSGLASSEVKKIDICFLLDVSGSMGGELTTLQEGLPSLFTSILSEFVAARIALVQYGQTANNGNPILVSDFTTDASALTSKLSEIVVSGSREVLWDGTVFCVENLTWTTRYDTRRHIAVLTDAHGEDSGQTANEASTIASLNSKQIIFNHSYNSGGGSSSAQNIAEATLGTFFNIQPNSELLEGVLAALTRTFIIDPNLEPIFMVYAQKEYTLGLEDGTLQVFEPVPFRFTLPGQNDQGLQDLILGIDNIDKRIGEWIDAASQYDAPAIARYRAYLSSDLTLPQTTSPLELVLTDIQKTAFEVTGRASVADIVNLKFLRERYLRSRFPSLGNT